MYEEGAFPTIFYFSSVKAHFVFDSPSQHVISEPFEPSPFMPGATRAFDNDFNVMTSRPQKGQTEADPSVGFLTNEKENTKENNVAKIKVVVCHSVLHYLFLLFFSPFFYFSFFSCTCLWIGPLSLFC